MAKRVYRIENRYNKGPFSATNLRHAVSCVYGWGILGERMNPYDMPSPCDDAYAVSDMHATLNTDRRHERPAFVYAFPDLKTLRRWFRPKLLQHLSDEGFTINIYDIGENCEHAESESQIVFHLPTAQFVREYGI